MNPSRTWNVWKEGHSWAKVSQIHPQLLGQKLQDRYQCVLWLTYPKCQSSVRSTGWKWAYIHPSTPFPMTPYPHDRVDLESNAVTYQDFQCYILFWAPTAVLQKRLEESKQSGSFTFAYRRHILVHTRSASAFHWFTDILGYRGAVRPAYSLCHPPVPCPLYKNCIETWRYCYNSHRTVRRVLASSALLGPHYKNFVLRSMSLTIESCAPLTVPSIITHQSKLTIKPDVHFPPEHIRIHTVPKESY